MKQLNAPLIPKESVEQVNFIKYLHMRHPLLFYYSSTNMGQRPGKFAARMKAEGMISGIPDLFFPSLFMYIEMKRVKESYATEKQRFIMDKLESYGYKCYVCKGCDDAIKVVDREVKERSRTLTESHDD
jgi:hypothetical protein